MTGSVNNGKAPLGRGSNSPEVSGPEGSLGGANPADAFAATGGDETAWSSVASRSSSASTLSVVDASSAEVDVDVALDAVLSVPTDAASGTS